MNSNTLTITLEPATFGAADEYSPDELEVIRLLASAGMLPTLAVREAAAISSR
jgi:hypothetical protein